MKTRSVQHVRSACLEAQTELVRWHGWQQRTAQPHQQVLLEAIVGTPLQMYILPAQICSQDARICHSCSVVFRAIRLTGNFPPQNGGGIGKDYREQRNLTFLAVKSCKHESQMHNQTKGGTARSRDEVATPKLADQISMGRVDRSPEH